MLELVTWILFLHFDLSWAKSLDRLPFLRYILITSIHMLFGPSLWWPINLRRKTFSQRCHCWLVKKAWPKGMEKSLKKYNFLGNYCCRLDQPGQVLVSPNWSIQPLYEFRFKKMSPQVVTRLVKVHAKLTVKCHNWVKYADEKTSNTAVL